MELKLPNKFLSGKAFSEHHHYYNSEILSAEELFYYHGEIYFKAKVDNDFCCFKIDSYNKVQTSYFIGIDWLSQEKNKAIYVQPKLNKGDEQLDYINMLFSLMGHPETLEHVDDIYDIKWEEEYIEIENKSDRSKTLEVFKILKLNDINKFNIITKK